MTTFRAQFQYNVRILLANSYWLLIIPLVASQLVIFWHMAVASMLPPGTVARSCELVIPLLAAFLCAHVVASEHRYRVDELVFVRPRHVLLTIVMRFLALYGIAAILAAMMLYVYKAGLKKEFNTGLVLLAGVPSMLFLSMLSMAFSAAWRTPAAGVGVALVYWAADATRGAVLNPLLTLQGYAIALDAASTDQPPRLADWAVSKGLLLLLAAIAAWAGFRCLGRPASPRRWRAAVRVSAGALAFAALYLVTGAFWQLNVAQKAARGNPDQARIIYQRAFSGYGPLPVAFLFGPAFVHYVGYPALDPLTSEARSELRQETVNRLRDLAERWPHSRWAPNALYEVTRVGANFGATSGNTPTDAEAALYGLRFGHLFLDRYPTSSFAPEVAARMVGMARRLGDQRTMLWAYDRLTTAYPSSPAAGRAAGELREWYMSHGQVAKGLELARVAAQGAPPEQKPEALLTYADLLAKTGHKQEAIRAYGEVEAAVNQKLDALGLRLLTPDNATAENIRRRTDILRLRSRARDGIEAVKSGRRATTGGETKQGSPAPSFEDFFPGS